MRMPKFSSLIFDRDMTHWYRLYDKKYFKGRLPVLEVYYGPLSARKERFAYGCTAFLKGKPIYIALNNKLNRMGEEISRLTLLHEMVHVSMGSRGAPHGPLFHEEKRRLIKAGALDDIF